MEKDKAAKRAKLEREKALGAAGKAGAPGKAGGGRQDPPWLRPGITVKVSTRQHSIHGWGCSRKLCSV